MLPLKATYLKDQLVLRKAHIKAPVSQSQLSQCVPAMPQHQDLGTSCLCGPVGQTLWGSLPANPSPCFTDLPTPTLPLPALYGKVLATMGLVYQELWDTAGRWQVGN